jgi:nucleotide-binding universal stress UspA family protein
LQNTTGGLHDLGIQSERLSDEIEHRRQKRCLMYSRILVPLDGSSTAEQVLPYVRLLGKKTGTNVTLLRALEDLPAEIVEQDQGAYLNDAIGRELRQQRRKLNQVAAVLNREGISTSVIVEEGKPEELIITQAEKLPDTLIAMATHGRSGVGRWVMGSVTDRVLHATVNPMLVVRAKEEAEVPAEKIETIIVPLDGSLLGEGALPYAQDIAKTTDAVIILVRVVAPGSFYYGTAEYYVPAAGDAFGKVTAGATEYVSSIAKQLTDEGVSEVKGVTLNGPPAAVLVDTAKEYANSMVVMTTHGRSGIGRWVMGSVADHVVRHSGDPVVMIRAANGRDDD